MNRKQRRAQAAKSGDSGRKAGGSRLRHELDVANRRILDAEKNRLAASFLALSPDRRDPLRGELSRSMSSLKETDELTDDDIVGLLTEGYEQGAMLAARLQGEEPGFAFETAKLLYNKIGNPLFALTTSDQVASSHGGLCCCPDLNPTFAD